jgi:hypothetical protein
MKSKYKYFGNLFNTISSEAGIIRKWQLDFKNKLPSNPVKYSLPLIYLYGLKCKNRLAFHLFNSNH